MTDFTTYSLDDLFRDTLFAIPDYQRGYDWTRKEVSDFWVDLVDLQSDRQHFLGTVVLFQTQVSVRRDRPIQHYTVHEVVDGQQRLTTIIILLQCMLTEFRRLAAGNSSYNDSVPFLESFLHIVSNGQQQLRLTLNSDLREFFQLHIMQDSEHPNPTLIAQQHLIAAKRFFRDRLKDEEEKRDTFGAFLDELQDKLTSRMRFTVFKTRAASDVGLMFETLNNRGRPLTEMEKVKNYLLYTARAHYRGESDRLHQLVTTINTTWTTVLQTLARFQVTDAGAMRHEDQLIRMHGLSVGHGQWHTQVGAEQVKQLIVAKAGANRAFNQAILNYCSTLSEGVVMYCTLQKPTHILAYAAIRDPVKQARLRHWTWKIAELKGDKAFCPLLVQASRVCSTDDDDFHSSFYTLLAYSEVYMVRVYKIANRKTSAGHPDLFRLAASLADVPRGAAAAQMPRILLRIKQLIMKFSREFGDLGYTFSLQRDYDLPFMKYVLYEYERDLWFQLRQVGPTERYEHLSVEHVFPQTLSEDPQDYWQRRFPRRHTHAGNCNALGNLSLTTGPRNSTYSNRSFEDKRGDERSVRDCYANSPFLIEKQFASGGHWSPTPVREWTSEEIKMRGKYIANWIEQRWGNPMRETPTFLPASFDVDGFFDDEKAVLMEEKDDEMGPSGDVDEADSDEDEDEIRPTRRLKRARPNTLQAGGEATQPSSTLSTYREEMEPARDQQALLINRIHETTNLVERARLEGVLGTLTADISVFEEALSQRHS